VKQRARRFILESMRGRSGLGALTVRAALRALSLPYAFAVRARGAAYGSGLIPVHHPPCPVISVGNLTAGGTGKTPAVAYLARRVQEMNRFPAVLCRGYGAKTEQGLPDETASMEEGLAVYADPDRVASARRALADGADCVVLDDGFQHHRLGRDLDILLLDVLDPWGGGRVLPAGFLRESPSAARRADAIVLTRADQVAPDDRRKIVEALRASGARAEVFLARHAPWRLEGDLAGTPSTLKGMPAFLFSGVGNPAGFRRTAEDLGVGVLGETRFADHHDYRPEDVSAVAGEAERRGAKMLLTTTKDWVKVKSFPRGAMPLSSLRVRFEIFSGEERLKALVGAALERGDRRKQAAV